MDTFLWDTCVYFSPMHILRTSDAYPSPPFNLGHKLVHFQPCNDEMMKDIEFTRDNPFFATADSPMVLVKGGSIDHINSQMMQVRWRIFHFWRHIPQEQQIAMILCPHCFAKFIIDYRLSCRLRVTNNVDRVHVSRSTPPQYSTKTCSILCTKPNIVVYSKFVPKKTLLCVVYHIKFVMILWSTREKQQYSTYIPY